MRQLLLIFIVTMAADDSAWMLCEGKTGTLFTLNIETL